jgi:hypothetical protein
MPFEALSPGVYHVGLNFSQEVSISAGEMEIKLEQDDTTILYQQTHGRFDFDYVFPEFVEQPVTLTQGTHTFDVDFRLTTALGSAIMQYAELTVWRIS